MSKASAPGKTILFGEHAVVYGYPALVCAVDARLITTLKPAKESWLEVPAIGRNDSLDNPLEVYQFYKRGIELLGIEPVHIHVDSQFPISAGMGSSAAMACSFMQAASDLAGLNLSKEQIREKAHEMEKVVHGNPSGVDTSISTYGGLLEFRKGNDPARFTSGANLPLLIGYTGKEGMTKVTVAHVRELFEKDKRAITRIFEEIHDIEQQAKTRLLAGEMDLIGPLMDRNHALLQQLGVSSLELDRLVQAAKDAGAQGAKLTGGGGGGCMIALGGEEVAKALGAAGGQVIETGLSKDGVRSER